MSNLDQEYPKLSALVHTVLALDLETLASRAPTAGYDAFDLERLLANSRDYQAQRAAINAAGLKHAAVPVVELYASQVAGFLATLEAYLALGVVKNPTHFLTKKLLTPTTARVKPPSSEMLDTLTECSWGLWLHDLHGNLEEERPLPGANGDVDFFVLTSNGPLWVDCISVAPHTEPGDLSIYLTNVVRSKWRKKFGRSSATRTLPAAIAVSVHKNQEHLEAAITFNRDVGHPLLPTPSLNRDCPGLQCAWFGMPPWHDGAHRPEIIASWTRPF